MSDINKFITSPIPKIIKKISILEKNTNTQIKTVNSRIDDIHGFQGPRGPQGYTGFQGFQGATFEPSFNIISVDPFWTNKNGGDKLILTTQNLPYFSSCFMDDVQVPRGSIDSTGPTGGYVPISKDSAEITSTLPIRASRNYNTNLKIIGPYWENAITDIQYYQLAYITAPPLTIDPNVTFNITTSVQDQNHTNLTNVGNMQLDVSSVPTGITGTLSSFVGSTGSVTFNNLSFPTNVPYTLSIMTHNQPNSRLISNVICGDVTSYVPLTLKQINLGYDQSGTYKYYFNSLFISSDMSSFLVHDAYYGFNVLPARGAIIKYQINNSNDFTMSQIITPNTGSTTIAFDGLHANNDLSEFITLETTTNTSASHIYLHVYNGSTYNNTIMIFSDLSEDIPDNYRLSNDRVINKLVLNNALTSSPFSCTYTAYYRTSTYYWQKSGVILYTGSHPPPSGPTDAWLGQSELYVSGDGLTIGITDGFDIFIYSWNSTTHLYELLNTLTPTNPTNLSLSGIVLNNDGTTLLINGSTTVIFSFSRPNNSSSSWTEITPINVTIDSNAVIHNNITDNGNKFTCTGNAGHLLLFTKTTGGTSWTQIHDYANTSGISHITKYGSQIIYSTFSGTSGNLYSLS